MTLSEKQTGSRVLEICVDDAAGLAAAVKGGADRIELCSALGSGGLTPSRGFMSLAALAPIPVYALIRPRIGDFVYSEDDIAVMIADIEAAQAAGLAGVVIGATRAPGMLDRPVLERLVAAAADLDLTLHRAFDVVGDFDAALDLAIELGFSRILTSGGARHAEDGIQRLTHLSKLANGRISIMPGGGVRPQNVARFLAIPGVCEVHASSSQPRATDPRLVDFGFAGDEMRHTDEATVRALKTALQQFS
ncbi:copper homeostasis protein CutC [Rhizobium sp. Root274]|uniref:copper homeostasis protein CutC n=1 Tax=unclassified Rhizobium TaxID=2613769 RepID=UPI000713CEF5|nr:MULTISPECIES: copper homeostasis protein CutC [unclassified Rhizobium]KQW29552.1 copper homeostasis protein CutC [Rhizobium sp. Root1240]KRD29744.1 copper homeostasis protein CutC [Rhizobium sp. Root274]